MSREIRFRAFIDGEMIGPDCLAFEEYELLADQLSSEPNLMQYTGLKDKNGVEIYEGDKVKFTVDTHIYGSDSISTQHIGYVIYSGSAFKLWNRPDWEFYGGDGARILDNINEKNIEVIGNVYQHSELLEEK